MELPNNDEMRCANTGKEVERVEVGRHDAAEGL